VLHGLASETGFDKDSRRQRLCSKRLPWLLSSCSTAPPASKKDRCHLLPCPDQLRLLAVKQSLPPWSLCVSFSKHTSTVKIPHSANHRETESMTRGLLSVLNCWVVVPVMCCTSADFRNKSGAAPVSSRSSNFATEPLRDMTILSTFSVNSPIPKVNETASEKF
jgi:hypothetical protein